MRADSREQFDAVLIGGGPAGSAAAITLSRADRRILMIEKNSLQETKIGESLPPAALPLLAELGVKQRFLADGHTVSCGNQSAWGSDELRSVDFIRDPNGAGWHLNRARFDSMLRNAARESGAGVLENTRLIDAMRDSAGTWLLRLTSERGVQTINTRWVLDCTGRNSWFARRQGVKRQIHDRLIAYWTMFTLPNKSEPDLDSLTLIESVRDGWWYTALLPSAERVVVFFTDAETEAAKAARESGGFLSLIEETVHVSNKLDSSRYSLSGTPRAAIADTSKLEQVFGDHWLATGDACFSLDPLSSQGIFNALYTGLKAGSAVDSHLSGEAQALRRYAEALDSVFSAYLYNRSLYYDCERRWSRSPFWSARRGTLFGRSVA